MKNLSIKSKFNYLLQKSVADRVCVISYRFFIVNKKFYINTRYLDYYTKLVI